MFANWTSYCCLILNKLSLDLFSQAVFSGQAIAGIVASVINIIALSVTDNQKTSAVVFFSMAVGITLLIIVAFYRLCQNPFFRNYRDDPYTSDKRVSTMSMGSRFTLSDFSV